MKYSTSVRAEQRATGLIDGVYRKGLELSGELEGALYYKK